MAYVCHWCGAVLGFTERGWTHPGGGVYVRVCTRCGFWDDSADPAIACKFCGGEMVDHHCATPKKKEEGNDGHNRRANTLCAKR